MYKLVIISVNSPIIMGIYANKCNKPTLLYMINIEGKISEIMPLLFNYIISNKIHHNIEKTSTQKCVLKECKANVNLAKEYNVNIDKVDSTKDTKEIKQVDFSVVEALQCLTNFSDIESIYYARGVGSLSAIKLTHIFLHTISLSLNIPIYATNSFYFTDNNEIKAFANMSFFLNQDSKTIKDDEKNCIQLSKSISPSTHFTLPNILIENDFCESCTPLYITPVI